ncbi:hypothetical protein Dsin_024673 [Dipteronia sinensis]|uniref:Reverse transcriptase zinc-binding domain-containing protein n=1 Tax=Dipteronia sinensis TaxID=43782 RepID=A0AAD9ZVW8_9ROSI|nr:hypothetical protein Dsin_024673 [Dipteronia sinensis]
MASLKTPHPLVPWFELVWYSHNIPRMSFILWLAIRGRLSMLDRVPLYNPYVGTLCVLYSSSPETHAHLLFECAYSKVIWSHLKDMCGRPWNGHSWPRFITWAAQQLEREIPFHCCQEALSCCGGLLYLERKEQ